MFWTVCRHCHRPYPKINLGHQRHDGESLDLKRLTCKFGYGTCFQSAWIPVQVITDTGSGLRVHPGRLSGRYALSAGVTGLGDIGVPQERRCVRQTGSSMHLNRLSQAILVCLLFISCSSAGNGELGSKNFFLEAAEEQQNQERIWKGVTTEKIAELPIDEEIVLYDPGYIIPDINGDVYVVDYGVYEILRFDSSGAYVRSYGNGLGKGPGEFSSITSVSIVSDSIISVIDNSNRTKSSFSKTSGRLVDSELFDTRKAPASYAVTDSGIEYIVRYDSKFLFESRFEGNNVEFGELIENQDSFAGLLVDGLLGTHGNNMVFVPLRFPAILIYDVDGTLLVSKKTMAYDDSFEEPRDRKSVV